MKRHANGEGFIPNIWNGDVEDDDDPATATLDELARREEAEQRAAAAPTGSILFTIRYCADESRICITNSRGEVIAEPGWFNKATHGEFVTYIADAILRSSQDDAGYTDSHDIAMDYRDAVEGLDSALDTRLVEITAEE